MASAVNGERMGSRRSTVRSTTTDRATSPAFGLAIAVIVVLFMAAAVGVLVGSIAGDVGPDVEFEWTESGEGEELQVTAEHVGGEQFNATRASLEADGVGNVGGSVGLDRMVTVRENDTITVGLVEDARIEGGEINETGVDDGRDVIAVTFGSSDLEDGVVLVSDDEDDVSMDDLDALRITWSRFGFTAELDEYAIQG